MDILAHMMPVCINVDVELYVTFASYCYNICANFNPLNAVILGFLFFGQYICDSYNTIT